MDTKQIIAEKIAGEITLSPKPGQTIRKWRKIFDISQSELSMFLDVSPSVISDYESGRRKSPGIQTVRRIIDAFFSLDKKNNSKVLKQYQSMNKENEGIIEIMEYPFAVSVEQFIKQIDGKTLTSKKLFSKKYVNGFTLIDGIKTIKSISYKNYVNLYGWSTERALIFTGVQYGRSPMIAIRIHPIKPSLVVYHSPGGVDPLAVHLAEQEKIPLIVTNISLENLKNKLVTFVR